MTKIKTNIQTRVFVWNDQQDWRRIVRRAWKDLIDVQVIRNLKANPPKHLVSDDLGWLTRVIELTKGYSPPVLDFWLSDKLASNFEAIRVFHGCCTQTVDSYYQDGILPLEPMALASKHFPQVPAGVLRAAIQDKVSARTGRVHVVLDDVDLLENAGHYLIRGSEFLNVVAGELTRIAGKNSDLRNFQLGKPTMLTCNLPVAMVPEEQLREFARRMVLALLAPMIEPGAQSVDRIDFCFVLHQRLPPSCIVSHYHPTRIRNWHNNGTAAGQEAL